MAARPTIVGVATGTPDGGVAVVRISGPQAAAIARGLVGDLPPPRAARVRRIALGADGAERGLVLWMPGPGSFTGEDVVELHVHAGERNVQAVVEAVLRAGACAAGPGDFSRRAFELGRLGLDEAEGIAAIIGAQTDEALRQARRLAGGELGREVEALRTRTLQLRAEIEANLDFPEDVEDADVRRWWATAAELQAVVRGWLARFEAGRRARQRTRIVLAGPPNAGKSSVFNALLGRARALVAETPGTTRDYVEAELGLGRWTATLVDTAGLRDTDDAVERAGVAWSTDQVAGADVVVWMEAADAPDASAPPLGDVPVVRVETKRDLGQRRAQWLGVSVRGPAGGSDAPDGAAAASVEALRAELTARLSADAGQAWIGLARHRARAEEAAEALAEARARLHDAQALELAAFSLQVAQGRLGEITGRAQTGAIAADVLAEIFARFCIGK